jgi:hypothetical protein
MHVPGRCPTSVGARYPARVTGEPEHVEAEELFPAHQPYPPEGDSVDEASEESFPASDAPSTWSHEGD